MGNSGFQVWISWDTKIKTTTKTHQEDQHQVLNFYFPDQKALILLSHHFSMKEHLIPPPHTHHKLQTM